MNAQLTESLLHVAFPSKATMQQPPVNDATGCATTTQHPSPPPASLLDLARNKLRNNHATSSQKDAQQAHQKEGVDVARFELVRLVRFCGEAYGFTEDEHTEALTRALADQGSALTCFRTIKAEILEETFLDANDIWRKNAN